MQENAFERGRDPEPTSGPDPHPPGPVARCAIASYSDNDSRIGAGHRETLA